MAIYSVRGGLFRSILLLLAGIFLIWARNIAATVVVMSMGGLIAAYGISLFFSIQREKYIMRHDKFGWSLIVFALLCVITGLFILIRPDVLISFFAFAIGILLVLYGLYRTIALISLSRSVSILFWSYLPSALSIVVGVVVIFLPNQVAALPFILLGLGFILNAVDELLYYLRIKKG